MTIKTDQRGYLVPVYSLFCFLVVFLFLYMVGTAHADDQLVTHDYRDFPWIGSRNIIWIIAEVHLLFASFVLGVPIFASVCEFVGFFTHDQRYDRLAKEFTKLLTASFGTTATFGGILLFLLIGLYPKFFNYLTEIFLPTYFLYVLLFIFETAILYLYWYGWDAMAKKKKTHLFLGVLLNIIGISIMFTSDMWLTYQASPVIVSEGMGYWEKLWTVIHNPTWMPVNIHRLIGNVVLGGFVCGAYAAIRYLGAATQEEREHYDWMGYVGNFVGVFGLLPLPFAGYWLMREVYQYNQQMGITLMGGALSWLFILQAILIGGLFTGANYYFWQGLLHRTTVGLKYKKIITVMLIILLVCFGVWLTPHSLVATLQEARKMGGAHHPLLGVFGVMSAKLTVVNIMILTTFLSFLVYWGAGKQPIVKWAPAGKVVQGIIFFIAAVGVVWLGVYGYYVPAIIRVNYLSVIQVLAVLSVLLTVTPMTALMMKSAKVTDKMTWGRMVPSSQYALVLNAVIVILLMTMMGYARSASRLNWHIYGVMRDTTPYSFTPPLGTATVYQGLCTFIFLILLSFIFWVVSLTDKGKVKAEVSVSAGPMKVSMGGGWQYYAKSLGLATGLLFTYSFIAFQMPQVASVVAEEENIDFSKITNEKELVSAGQKIFFGKGQCALCHSFTPTASPRAPILKNVGMRLTREFMHESEVMPQAYIKFDFDPPEPKPYPSQMPTINRPPIGLNENELLAVISFLQSQGGKVTVSVSELTFPSQENKKQATGAPMEKGRAGL
ncbi:MAG: cytochrome ubiquinol oxidase subunit I [Nitrospiria bacterium]